MLQELQVHLTDLITRQGSGLSIALSFFSPSSPTGGLFVPGGAQVSTGRSAVLHSWLGYFAQLGALHLDSEPCFFVQCRRLNGSHKGLEENLRMCRAAHIIRITKCNADSGSLRR